MTPPNFPAFPAFLGLMMIVGVRGWKKLWQICLMPPFRFFRLSTCSKVFWLGQFRTLALVAHCFVLTTLLHHFFVIMHGLQCFLCRLSSSLHPSHSSLSTTPHPSSSFFFFFLSDVRYPLNTCLVQSDSPSSLSIFSSFISRSTSIDVSCFLSSQLSSDFVQCMIEFSVGLYLNPFYCHNSNNDASLFSSLSLSLLHFFSQFDSSSPSLPSTFLPLASFMSHRLAPSVCQLSIHTMYPHQHTTRLLSPHSLSHPFSASILRPSLCFFPIPSRS